IFSLVFSLICVFGLAQREANMNNCVANYYHCTGQASITYHNESSLCQFYPIYMWQACESAATANYFQSIANCGAAMTACLGGNQ
ncbi:MAG: hypothetical protein AAFO91_07510, partial [Bacteroidota bacterium]